jgi:hypothetical protein
MRPTAINVTNNNPAAVTAINDSYTPLWIYDAKFLGKDVGYPVFWGGGNGANDQNLWNMGSVEEQRRTLTSLKDDFSKVHGAHTQLSWLPGEHEPEKRTVWRNFRRGGQLLGRGCVAILK